MRLPGERRTTPSAGVRLREVVVVHADATGVFVGPDGTPVDQAVPVTWLNGRSPQVGDVCVVAEAPLGVHLLSCSRDV